MSAICRTKSPPRMTSRKGRRKQVERDTPSKTDSPVTSPVATPSICFLKKKEEEQTQDEKQRGRSLLNRRRSSTRQLTRELLKDHRSNSDTPISSVQETSSKCAEDSNNAVALGETLNGKAVSVNSNEHSKNEFAGCPQETEHGADILDKNYTDKKGNKSEGALKRQDNVLSEDKKSGKTHQIEDNHVIETNHLDEVDYIKKDPNIESAEKTVDGNDTYNASPVSNENIGHSADTERTGLLASAKDEECGESLQTMQERFKEAFCNLTNTFSGINTPQSASNGEDLVRLRDRLVIDEKNLDDAVYSEKNSKSIVAEGQSNESENTTSLCENESMDVKTNGGKEKEGNENKSTPVRKKWVAPGLRARMKNIQKQTSVVESKTPCRSSYSTRNQSARSTNNGVAMEKAKPESEASVTRKSVLSRAQTLPEQRCDKEHSVTELDRQSSDVSYFKVDEKVYKLNRFTRSMSTDSEASCASNEAKSPERQVENGHNKSKEELVAKSKNLDSSLPINEKLSKSESQEDKNNGASNVNKKTDIQSKDDQEDSKQESERRPAKKKWVNPYLRNRKVT